MDFGLWRFDRVVGNIFFSKCIQPKTPYHITLANESKAKASDIGQATPFSSLSLDFVLVSIANSI